MCGMSLLLSGNTINFWLASNSIDPKTIGLFSLIVVPYIFKFLIAIFLAENKVLFLSRFFSHYKAWLIFAQTMLAIALFVMGFLDPKNNLMLIAILGCLIAVLTVIQDIILNYNRIDILEENEQVNGTAMYTIGYRIGLLFSGAGVIFLSAYLSWQIIYFGLAVIYVILTIFIIFIFQEKTFLKRSHKKTWNNIFILPFTNIKHFNYIIWIITFLILYKLSDYMLTIMTNPFLLSIGYNAVEIATISKTFGIIMAIIGGIASGPIISKFSLRKSLILFSVIHIGGHFFFIVLALQGKSIAMLYFITAYEAITAGMMMTAYIAFISRLCHGQYTASQYALLSSCMGLSRAIFPSFSGVIVDQYGWIIFFLTVICISIVTALFTCFIPKRLFENLKTNSI
jgi:PAT family beta-lactamase induction signal transducer AmpG